MNASGRLLWSLQQRRGMKGRHDAALVNIEPLAMFTGDAEVLFYDFHCGDAPKADDYPRLNERYLAL